MVHLRPDRSCILRSRMPPWRINASPERIINTAANRTTDDSHTMTTPPQGQHLVECVETSLPSHCGLPYVKACAKRASFHILPVRPSRLSGCAQRTAFRTERPMRGFRQLAGIRSAEGRHRRRQHRLLGSAPREWNQPRRGAMAALQQGAGQGACWSVDPKQAIVSDSGESIRPNLATRGPRVKDELVNAIGNEARLEALRLTSLLDSPPAGTLCRGLRIAGVLHSSVWGSMPASAFSWCGSRAGIASPRPPLETSS